MSAYEERLKKLRNKYGEKEDKKVSPFYSSAATTDSQNKYYERKNSLLEKYKPTVAVDGNFISTFFRDANNFFSSADSEYESVGWGNASAAYESREKAWKDLESRYKTVRSWLFHNRDKLDAETYQELSQSIEGFGDNGYSVLKAFEKAKNFYSKWETEAEYKFWDDHRTVEKRQAWYEATKKKIDDLKAEKAKFEPSIWKPDFGGTRARAKQIDAEIAALEADLLNYKRGNYNEKGQYYGSKSVDDYHQVTQNADFNIGSQKRDYVNPTLDEMRKADVMNNSSTWKFDGDGVYRDFYGNELAVDNTNTWYNPAAQKTKVTDKLSLYLSATEDDRLQGALGNEDGMWGTVMKEGYAGSWQYLEEPEIEIYYYLLNQNQESADKYLSDMKVELNRRQTLDEIGQWHTEYDEANLLKKIAMNAATVPAHLSSSAESFLENILSGDEYNPYSAANWGMHYSQTVRGDTAEDLDSTGFYIPVINFSLGDIYQVGMSRLDALAATSLLGGKGTVLLGMGAAQNEAYRLYKAGASPEQITWGALTAGAAETVFEYASFDKLIKLGDAKTVGQWVKNALIQGGIEASEEAFTEITNIITNAVIMGSQSDLDALYKANGNDWLKTGLALVQRVSQAGFGGFLGGIGAGGAQGGKTYVNNQIRFRQDGKVINSVDGGVDALKALANDVVGVSQPKTQRMLNKQISAVESKATNRKVGRLYDTVRNANNLANASANQADIAKSLQRKGFNSETANDIAAAIVARYNGEALTNAQKKLLKSADESRVVQNAISNIVENKHSTMGQREQNIRDFNASVSEGVIAKSPTNTRRASATTVEESQGDHYEISEDSITTDKEGNAVNIVGVESTEGGKLILKTENGTIDSGDVIYASESDALVYEAVANMGATPASAWAMINTATEDGGVSATEFATAAPLAYLYGKLGYEKGVFTNGKPRLNLTEMQSRRIYELGRSDAAAFVKTDSRADGKTTISDKNAGKEIIYEGFTYAKRKANKVQRASMEAVELINKVSSLEVHVYQSVKENGKFYATVDGKKRIAPNGYFMNGNKIYIDINAGKDGRGVMLFTLAHEIGHYIALNNAADFKAISDFLFEHYGEDAPIYEELKKKKDTLIESYKRDGMPIPEKAQLEKEAQEELVCDMLSRMLDDQYAYDKLMEFKQENLNAFQKLGEAIRKVLEKIAKVIGVYNTQVTDFQMAASVETFGEEAFRQLQDLYIKAFVQADANFQAAQAQKNTTEDGGVKYMARDGLEMMSFVPRGRKVNADLYIEERHGLLLEDIRKHLPELQNMTPVCDLNGTEFQKNESDTRSLKQKVKDFFDDIGNKVLRKELGVIALNNAGAQDSVEHGYGPLKAACFAALPAVLEKGLMFGPIQYLAREHDTYLFVAPVRFVGTKNGEFFVGAYVIKDVNTTRYKVHEVLTISKEGNRPFQPEADQNGERLRDDSLHASKVTQTDPIVNTESTQAMDIDVDEKTESVAPAILKSERTWPESDYVQERETAAKEIAKAIGVSVKKAKAYIDSVNGIAKMIAEDRVRLDYFSTPGRSSFVGNVEYGGSFDFSTLCKKRRLLTGTFTAIQKALPNTALTADEILDIRNRMKDAGLEVSCGLCYVEGSRANMGQFAKEFLKLYKQYYPDAWQPNMADVNTPDGIEWVRINHPECYEQYEYFWNHYGTLKTGDKNLFASQQKPKLYQLHTEYKGEILDKFNDDENVEEKNLNGGIRLQSFSDFEIVHLIDTMQIIMDMSRVGLAGQAYTKVPDFAWALGDTGLKINLSLIAKGVDESGNLIFDDIEGMPIDQAVALRDRYSKNVGTILVAFNDEQLLAAMADERVDYIIPFHRSQWKKSQYSAIGLPAKTKDYTYMQNEKFIKPQYHEYRGRMVKDKATNYMPNEYWDFSKSGKENAEAYLQMCARNNKRPKFYKFLQNNGDGSYSLKADGSTDGYWKLLIDFKMYDNDGNGSPQMPVRPEFNMDEATRMLNDYQGGHSNFPVAHGIVDEFVQEYKDSHNGTKFSERDSNYLDAVKRGDIDTAQKMVDEAARNAGYTEKVYHGTRSFGFTKLDVKKSDDGISFFATEDLDVAGTYSGTVVAGERNLQGKKQHLPRKDVPKLRNTIKDIAQKFLDEYTATFGHYDRMLMSAVEYVANIDSSDVTTPNELMEFATTAIDRVSGAHYNTMRSVEPGKRNASRAISEETKQKLASLADECSKKLSNLISSYYDSGVYGLYANTDNFLVIDANGGKWSDIRSDVLPEKNTPWKTRDVVQYAKENGYSGVTFKNIVDPGNFTVTRPATVYAFLSPQSQLKSADPVTYDKLGRVIPLSKRFNPKNNDIRYSDRGYSYEALASKPDMIVTTVEGNVPTNRADVVAQAKKNAAKVGKFNPKNGSISVHVNDIDTDVVVGTAGLKHSLDRRFNVNAPVTLQAGSILQNSIQINELTPQHPNAKSSYVLIGAAKTKDGQLYIVRSVVNRFSQELTSMDVLYAFNGKTEPDLGKKKETGRETIPNGPQLNTATITGSTISIAELLDYVNKYFPDILPEDVLKHYGYDARPDGDLGQDALYQERTEDSVSNRSLLADAFEGVAQNDAERVKVQEYRDKVALMDAEERKLGELNAQIKELSFAKGPRDAKKIRGLQLEARQTANRISTYDKQLLRLEASKPLQDVLVREKKAAYKRAEQKGKEALADYREKALREQQALTAKWQESRKAAVAKARETAEKRDARTKLQKLVLDTVNWISYPAKTDVKCPDILKKPYEAFLQGIDLSSKRLASGGEATKNDLRLANAMDSLATAIDRVMLSQDPSQEVDKVLDIGYLDLPADFVQKLRDMTESIKGMMVEGEYVVNTMTAAEVRQLSQMIRTLNHAIKTMSKLYANLRFANVEALGFDTMDFLDTIGEIEKTGGMKDFALWDNALPYYAFKRFGKGGESIFEGLMDAQDKLAFLAQDIFAFRDKTWTGKEAKAWSEDTHTIDLPNGNKLTLTTADAMSIYCLSRREHALPHLLGGGIRVMGIQKGSQKAKDSRSLLTMKDVDAIISPLTDRQKQVAEGIQEFMSTVCSDWGNEISMKRFLTREFNEKFYFPIESNDENLTVKDPAAQQSDLFRLLNISATKPLTQGANNEVIIRNIFDVFTGHASDMARLNAYGMALLDHMKWLNYRERVVNEEGQINVKGVRKSIEKAYGKAANSYVINLIKDVNGRASDGGDPTILMKWMRAAKTASVGNSLRVATLQVTSYPRAALVLSPKSLALGLTKAPNIRRAKKYCGIALWKSFGFYDTNISRSIEDQMKGVTDVKQKLIEWSLKGAEWGDAITWGALWNACEYEVAQTTTNKVGSEEFYQEVGKKLREVVYRTQVVDSNLTRSQIMRSKRGMAQEAAAFMSEPTLSANILMDAGFEFGLEKRRTGSAKSAWKKTGAYIGRAVAVYSVGQLAAALMEALWDAWRDDDDEEFGEKYLEAFAENLALDIVPFNKLPIVSDVFEAALGLFGVGFYSSDKMSTTWLTQAVSAVDAWKDVFSGGSSTTAYNALYKSTRALSSFYGVSFSGLMREGVALWNNTAGAYDSTLKIRQYDLANADLGAELYEAIMSGNTRQADSLKAQFDDANAMHSAVRKALRENDPRIKEAALAQYNGDPSERVRIARQIIADGFDQDDVVLAINAEASALKPDEGGSDPKKKGFYTATDFATEIANGDQASAYAAKADIIATAQQNGKTEKQAEESFVSYAKSELKKLFKAGYISEQKLIDTLVTFCGMEKGDAVKYAGGVAFEVAHPELDGVISYTQYQRWETDGQPRDVSLKMFTDVASFRDDGTSNSVKSQEEVALYISSLTSDRSLRHALWCCFYKASTSPWK